MDKDKLDQKYEEMKLQLDKEVLCSKQMLIIKSIRANRADKWNLENKK